MPVPHTWRCVQVKTAGIPSDIFAMKDLTLIDFSHNALKDVPPNVERAKCAIVLNLSHNHIENIPNQVRWKLRINRRSE
jgi:hypothetical protein